MTLEVEVLLDTSFILPSFGVEVGESVSRALSLLSRTRGVVRVYYSSYSLLEASAVLLREVKRGRLSPREAAEMAEEGVFAVTSGLEELEESPRAFREALRMYGMGHRDLFDNILYSLALENDVKFLTLDEELRRFILEKGMRDVTVTPGELAGRL